MRPLTRRSKNVYDDPLDPSGNKKKFQTNVVEKIERQIPRQTLFFSKKVSFTR